MLSEKMVNMLSAPLLKRKGPVPKGFVKSLVAANGGLAITEKLKERGVITTARPAVTPVLTCGNGKVTASRLVARGPMFVATATNPVKAKAIWPEAGEELAITFSVGGTALNFGNPDTPNISDWMEDDMSLESGLFSFFDLSELSVTERRRYNLMENKTQNTSSVSKSKV